MSSGLGVWYVTGQKLGEGANSCEDGILTTELCSGNSIVHTTLKCSGGEIHPTRPALEGNWTKRAKS